MAWFRSWLLPSNSEEPCPGPPQGSPGPLLTTCVTPLWTSASFSPLLGFQPLHSHWTVPSREDHLLMLSYHETSEGGICLRSGNFPQPESKTLLLALGLLKQLWTCVCRHLTKPQTLRVCWFPLCLQLGLITKFSSS